MLRFFPFIYPDELLYSAISRYYKYTGKGSVKLTFKELFGDNAHVFSLIDFPYYIDSFIKQFDSICYYTSDDIIFNFTMLPLYLPFLDSITRQYALNSMKTANGKNLYKKLGVMASNIPCLTNLKYCPDCLKEDLLKYGEVYLHRSHNIDGVFICYKHNKFLMTNCPICNVPISYKDKYQLIPLEYKCINDHDLIEPNCFQDSSLSEKELQLHLAISKIVHFILNYDFRSGMINFSTLQESYRFLLYQLNYLSTKGSIRQTKLKHDFINYYGSSFLNKLKLNIDFNNQYCWIKGFLNKKYRSSHPLKHILFLLFICKNDVLEIQRILSNSDSYSINLFGKGPWPCLNPISDHYLENIITDFTITICPKDRTPIGIFECSCGFIYTKHPTKSNDERYHYQSIKAFGHIWEEKLTKIILYEGGSLKSIARKMHCDPKTVVRHSINLGLPLCWEKHSDYHLVYSKCKIKCSKEYCEQLCIQYKNSLQNYILSFIEPPRINQIRKKYEREYKYLYHHNKTMLFDLLKPCKTRKFNSIIKSKVNWEERDSELLPLVANEIMQLLSSDKFYRITINKIGRDLGISYILDQYLDYLPNMSYLLHYYIESIEDYQIRRLKTIANKILQDNEPISKTKLCRLAGIKSTCSKNVKYEIYKILNN